MLCYTNSAHYMGDSKVFCIIILLGIVVFSFSIKEICNPASIVLLSFWNRCKVESFSIMPYNAAYAGSSLGFGTGINVEQT